MSSIMRWRNGLMACLVIGDAPVLSEVVETPQSQDRTPRCAIVLAVSPAPASYRVSGLVQWLSADLRSERRKSAFGNWTDLGWGGSRCAASLICSGQRALPLMDRSSRRS